MSDLRKCPVCTAYTLKPVHCDNKTISPAPAKYSPEDKYAKYRRIAKQREGLL